MKKSIITFFVIISVLISSIGGMWLFAKQDADTLPFTDVASGDWYYQAVKYCYNNDIFSGTSDTEFEPVLRMTRAMFVRTLANISKVNYASYTEGVFTDVDPESWYAASVNWAAKNNIVSGIGDGIFLPTKAVTREQMAAILYRYAEFNGIDMTCNDSVFNKFIDKTEVSEWAKQSMIWMTDKGLLNGAVTATGTLLDPLGTCTRAQAAQVLSLYNQLYPRPEPLPPIDLDELRISYSSISLCPANSLETFITAAKLGFNVIKCDIRPTKDGELICCHDAGYTLKEVEGEMMIANAFDADNCVLIRDMTAEECLSLKFSWRRHNNGLGHTARPCTLSEYLDVCLDYNVVPFITIRNEYMDEVIPKMLEIIEEKGVHDKCIINSMTFDSLQMLREVDPTIRLNFVTAKTALINTFHVKRALSISATLNGFNYTSSSAPPDYAAMKEALDMAKENNLTMYQSVIYTKEQWEEAKSYGFVGAQVAMPIFDYEPFGEAFVVNINGDELSFENVEDCSRPITGSLRRSTKSDEIYVKDIAYIDSKYDFADAIMPVWMNDLPHTITVTDEEGNNVEAYWSNDSAAIVLKTVEDGSYNITVTIGTSEE